MAVVLDPRRAEAIYKKIRGRTATSTERRWFSQYQQFQQKVLARQKSEAQAQQALSQKEYEQWLTTDEGKTYQAAQKYKTARTFKEESDHFKIGGDTYSKKDYEIIGHDDDTPETFQVRAKATQYKSYSAGKESEYSTYHPVTFTFKDNKLTARTSLQIVKQGGSGKARSPEVQHSIEYDNQKYKETYYKGGDFFRSQVIDFTGTKLSSDQARAKHYGNKYWEAGEAIRRGTLTQEEIKKIPQSVMESGYVKDALKDLDVTAQQYKKAAALTPEAQVREYGKVLVNTGKPLTQEQYKQAVSFTEQEQVKRYGRVVQPQKKRKDQDWYSYTSEKAPGAVTKLSPEVALKLSQEVAKQKAQQYLREIEPTIKGDVTVYYKPVTKIGEESKITYRVGDEKPQGEEWLKVGKVDEPFYAPAIRAIKNIPGLENFREIQQREFEKIKTTYEKIKPFVLKTTDKFNVFVDKQTKPFKDIYAFSTKYIDKIPSAKITIPTTELEQQRYEQYKSVGFDRDYYKDLNKKLGKFIYEKIDFPSVAYKTLKPGESATVGGVYYKPVERLTKIKIPQGEYKGQTLTYYGKDAFKGGFSIVKDVFWTQPAKGAAPVFKEVAKFSEGVFSRISDTSKKGIDYLGETKPGTLQGQATGVLKATKFTSDFLAGTSQKFIDRPEKGYKIVIGAAAFQGVVSPIVSKAPFIGTILSKTSKPFLGGYYGYAGIKSLTKPSDERARFIGYETAEMTAFLGAGKILNKASLQERGWLEKTYKTQYSGLPKYEAQQYKMFLEGKPLITSPSVKKAIMRRETFLQAGEMMFPGSTSPIYAKGEELFKYEKILKTTPSPPYGSILKQTDIDYGMVERLKPLGATAPAIVGSITASTPTLVTGGSLIPANIFEPEFKVADIKPGDIDFYENFKDIASTGKFIYKGLGGKEITPKIDIDTRKQLDPLKQYALKVTKQLGGRVGGSTGLFLQVPELGRMPVDIDVDFPKTELTEQDIGEGARFMISSKFGGDLLELDKTRPFHQKLIFKKDIKVGDIEYKKGEKFMELLGRRETYKVKGKVIPIRTRKLKGMEVIDVRDLLADKKAIAKFKKQDPFKLTKTEKDISQTEKGLADLYKEGILRLDLKAEAGQPRAAKLFSKELTEAKFEKLSEIHASQTMLDPNIASVGSIWKPVGSYKLRDASGRLVLSPKIQERRALVGAFGEDERFKDIPKFIAMQKGKLRYVTEHMKQISEGLGIKIQKSMFLKEQQQIADLEKGFMNQMAMAQAEAKQLGFPKEKSKFKYDFRGREERFDYKQYKESSKRFNKAFGEKAKKMKELYKSYDNLKDTTIPFYKEQPYSSASYYESPTSYTPYSKYSPYTQYTQYKPESLYKPYSQYKPYTTYKTYKPYTPYTPYSPYSQYKPYTPYKPYIPYKEYKLIVPPTFPGMILRGRKGKKQVAYNTYIKVGKTYKKANTVPHTEASAKGLGAKIVDDTIAARFKIKKTTTTETPKTTHAVSWSQRQNKFRTYFAKYGKEEKPIKQSEGFIEKRKFRIDSEGEKQKLKFSRKKSSKKGGLF